MLRTSLNWFSGSVSGHPSRSALTAASVSSRLWPTRRAHGVRREDRRDGRAYFRLLHVAGRFEVEPNGAETRPL